MLGVQLTLELEAALSRFARFNQNFAGRGFDRGVSELIVRVAALAPPAVVTVTATVPVPGGEVAEIEVDELTVTLAALLEPNLTAVAPLRFVPVIVTAVPPAAGPPVGLIAVTVGETLRFEAKIALPD